MEEGRKKKGRGDFEPGPSINTHTTLLLDTICEKWRAFAMSLSVSQSYKQLNILSSIRTSKYSQHVQTVLICTIPF